MKSYRILQKKKSLRSRSYHERMQAISGLLGALVRRVEHGRKEEM